MAKIYRVGDHFQEISGPLRDDFVTALMELRASTEEDIVLDFSGVETLSSIALAAVGKMHPTLEAEGRSLRIVGMSESIYALFEVTGLTQVLDIEKPVGRE